MEDNNLLDQIELKTEKVKMGIVDFKNNKFVHFFDLSTTNDPNLIIIVIIWRLKYDTMRFSVFCSKFFPNISIPDVTLINMNSIEEINTRTPVSVNENVKKKKFLVKK